jgi:hypothetical protein
MKPTSDEIRDEMGRRRAFDMKFPVTPSEMRAEYERRKTFDARLQLSEETNSGGGFFKRLVSNYTPKPEQQLESNSQGSRSYSPDSFNPQSAPTPPPVMVPAYVDSTPADAPKENLASPTSAQPNTGKGTINPYVVIAAIAVLAVVAYFIVKK